MRIAPTLLRVILSLSLVLNGTGLAAAHGGGAAPHDAAASVSGPDAPAQEPLCHEAPGGTGIGDVAASAGHPPKHLDAEMSAHRLAADCCDMDMATCDDACAQTLSATLLAGATAGAHMQPAVHPRARANARTGPPLPHPIRPPIV